LKDEEFQNLEFIKLDKEQELTTQILELLYKKNIQSLIIEGGAQTLITFISQNLWDEARVFTGYKEFKKGLPAPEMNKEPKFTLQIDSDLLSSYFND
jgi:diaminohydroxyphosphoribosylaminopyrimidine deaminase/5-amino-6-(5-phosphoribosylamino)uracil reductase